MNFDNSSFEFHSNNQNSNKIKKKQRSINTYSFGDKLKSISPEHWVDIVCCSIIGTVLIVVLCNWNSVMNGLFSLMFPIIIVLSKIIIAILGVLGIGGVATARIRHHRRWYW